MTLKRKEIAMKKLTALLLSALLCLSLLAGCQQGAEETKNPTCEEVLTAIQDAIGEDNLPMMGEIDDETLSVLYGFEPTELLEDYRGSISQMNVHADEILVMKVKRGQYGRRRSRHRPASGRPGRHLGPIPARGL